MRTKKTMIFSFTSLVFLITISSLFIASASGNVASDDNFTWENADLIDSIIYFKSEGIDLGIPEEYVIYEYDGLNGINALIPLASSLRKLKILLKLLLYHCIIQWSEECFNLTG